MRLEVFLPGPLKNPLNGSHEHWAVRARWAKTWRTKACLFTKAALAGHVHAPNAPKHVQFVAHVWNLLDDDGLEAALKPVRDGLKDARVIHDDGPRSGHTFSYRQEIHRNERGVWIVVE